MIKTKNFNDFSDYSYEQLYNFDLIIKFINFVIIKEIRIMFIKVAGEKKEYPEGLTVKELIEKEDVETPQYVTVTINDEFVESGAFETTEVKDGDEIEFLYFMGGGAR